DVYQLHNTSAVLRTCEVFGIQELHIIEEKWGKKIDKEIALGAQKWVDAHRYNTTQMCIDNLKAQGYKIIATTPHAASCYLENCDVHVPSRTHFGTDGRRLAQEALHHADRFLDIPRY